MNLNDEQRFFMYGYLSIAEAKADDLQKYLINNYVAFSNDNARETFSRCLNEVTKLLELFREEEKFYKVEKYEIKKAGAK